MGAWSVSSYGNDSTEDTLLEYVHVDEDMDDDDMDDDDIDENVNIFDTYDEKRFNSYQEMVDQCLKDNFKCDRYEYNLGLVIHFLLKSAKINNEYLIKTYEYARYELNTDNINGWFNFDKRKKQLEFEMIILQHAINDGGIFDKKYLTK